MLTVAHGAWRAGLEERGISKSTARRSVTLRQRYAALFQVETFRSVAAMAETQRGMVAFARKEER